MNYSYKLLWNLSWLSPQLIVDIILLAITFSRVRVNKNVRAWASLAFVTVLLSHLLVGGGIFVEDWYDHANNEIGLEEEVDGAATKRDTDKQAQFWSNQESRHFWMWTFWYGETLLDSFALIALLVGIYAIGTTVETNGSERENSTHENKAVFGNRAAFECFTGIILLGLWVIYICYFGEKLRRLSEPSFTWWSIDMTCRSLPYLAVLCGGIIGLSLSKTTDVRIGQVALCGLILKAVNYVFLVILGPAIAYSSFKGNINSDVVDVISTLSRIIVMFLDVTSNLFLWFALMSEQQHEKCIPSSSIIELEDPLFELRFLIRRIGFVIIGLAWISVLLTAVCFWAVEKVVIAAMIAFLITIGVWMKAIVMTFMMPNQKPNAIYLRSFRNDLASYPVRIAIQEALGPQFRLTGIRDPRKRKIAVWGYVIGPAIWAYRYCTPKYMDLEAGEDWKARLWNSLQSARIAILDLTDVTSFVSEEIKLASDALGHGRLLFVIDESRTLDEWEQFIHAKIERRPEGQLQIVCWNHKGLRSFKEKVANIVVNLPGPIRHRSAPSSLCGPTYRTRWIERRAIGFLFTFGSLQFLLTAIMISVAMLPGIPEIMGAKGTARLLSPFFWAETAMALWLLWNMIIFAKEVGVNYERRKAVAAIVALSAIIVGTILLSFIR